MKKLMNPQNRSVIELKPKGRDSKTLPSEVMYAITAVIQVDDLKHENKLISCKTKIAS